MTRRIFAGLSASAAGAAITHGLTARDIAASAVTTNDGGGAPAPGAQSAVAAAEDDKLQSEFLFDLILETQPPNNVGSPGVGLVVPVAGGTFEGPKLKGTVVGPSGDWIIRRPDGSLVLDVRLVLQTDDAEKICVTWRGISYTPHGGKQYARILPMFETGAARYAWLNNIVAVGVHRGTPGRVAYRVYQIL